MGKLLDPDIDTDSLDFTPLRVWPAGVLEASVVDEDEVRVREVEGIAPDVEYEELRQTQQSCSRGHFLLGETEKLAGLPVQVLIATPGLLRHKLQPKFHLGPACQETS